MWFKLASATFSTHLGSMASLSNSISIKYTANGFSYTTTSVTKTASSASLVLNLMSGWTCASTPTVSVSGAAVVDGTPTWSSNKLTIKIKPASSKSTFEAAGSIINVSVSGATSSGGSGGTTPPVNPPSGDGETNLTSQFTWTVGGVIWADGKDRDDTNWLRSNYVDIGDYTQLRFTQAQTTTASTVLGYAFYNSSQAYISGASNGGAPSYAPVEKIIDVPTNAKYIRTMWMNTTNANYSDSINNISNFYCYGIGGSGSTTPTTYTFTVNPTPTTATVTLSASGYSTVSGTGSKSITVASGTNVSWTVSASGYDTQNGTQSVTSSSSKNVTLTTSSSGGSGTGAETNLTSQFSWTPGTINATAGSTSSGDTNWLYSNTIDVSAYSKIRFAHIQTPNSATTLGYTFYNSSMTAVSGATNAGTSYDPVNRTVDVPSGAQYFRCMWINTSNSNYNTSVHDISKFYCYGID